MVVLECKNLKKLFGPHVVLDDITFTVNQGDRVGIIGVNGSGKSTLFRILSGEMESDAGEFALLTGITTGYLKQEAQSLPESTVWDSCVSTFEHILAMESELRRLEQLISDAVPGSGEYEKLMAEYGDVSHAFEQEGGYSHESRVRGALKGLGFTEEQFYQTTGTLSGGQKTRLELARLMLKKPPLIMLDEPTNHLDIDATQWLEDELKDYPGTVLIISHDRYLLDKVCTHILEIERGRAEKYEGNYEDFELQKREDLTRLWKQFTLQQKEIARQEAIIVRYRSYNREKSIKKARARERVLEKMERIDRPFEQRSIHFFFEARRESAGEVVIAEDVSMAFGENRLFDHVSFLLRKGERLGILGPKKSNRTVAQTDGPDSG